MKKILVLSDSHGYIDDHIINHAKCSDEIWHAGDIGDIKIIDDLKKYSLVRAVYGNIDNNIVRKEFHENIFFKCEDIPVFITHIGGYPGKYPKNITEKLIKHKPKLFICGHSHILKIIQDDKFKLLHINPGAIGIIGFHKKRTMVKFEIDKAEVKNLYVIELGERSKI
tara:strand:- start:1914 stop:2417 length:504 start_codon:yes stop_codon:yes gene_type:complete